MQCCHVRRRHGRLFGRSDPSMPEDKKLRHLMRGVKQEIFAGLMRSPPGTVPGFVEEVTVIDRALARQNSHPEAAISGTNVLTAWKATSTAFANFSGGLSGRSCRQCFMVMSCLLSVAVITVSGAELIRNEIRRAVRVPEPADECALSELPRCMYAKTLCPSRYCPSPTVATFEPQPTAVNFMQRPTVPRPAVLFSKDRNSRKSDLRCTPDLTPLAFTAGRLVMCIECAHTTRPICVDLHSERRVYEAKYGRLRLQDTLQNVTTCSRTDALGPVHRRQADATP